MKLEELNNFYFNNFSQTILL